MQKYDILAKIGGSDDSTLDLDWCGLHWGWFVQVCVGMCAHPRVCYKTGGFSSTWSVICMCAFLVPGTPLRGDICHLLGIDGIAIRLPSRVTGTHHAKEFPGLENLDTPLH